ncbi:unnamed protein product, partial [marine sediment metagenome]
MSLTHKEVEKHIREIEAMALEPYTQSASWYGLTVSFESGRKRDGSSGKEA